MPNYWRNMPYYGIGLDKKSKYKQKTSKID